MPTFDPQASFRPAPPPLQPPQVSTPTGGSGRSPWALTIILVVAALAVLVVTATLVAWAIGRSEGSDSPIGGTDGSVDVRASDGRALGEGGRAEVGGEDGWTNPTGVGTTPTTTVTTTTAAPQKLRVAGVTASNVRPAVDLRCAPYERATYGPELLFDSDDNTGWGASKTDGTGQSVLVRFDGPVLLTRMGVTAGYTKVGPRKDRGCADVSAFGFNRHVTSVEYAFDDGSTIVQYLDEVPGLQFIEAERPITTSTARITILSTVRPSGADDDTVISEAIFEGVP